MKKTNKKGFTLVELLVVIAIIAIIAAVAVPVTIGQINNSKIKTAKSEMTNIVSAINTGYGAMLADGKTAAPATLKDYIKISKVEYVKSFTITEGKTVVFVLNDADLISAANERTFTLDVTDTLINSTESNKYKVAADGVVTYAA